MGEPDATFTRRELVALLANAFDAPGQPGVTAPAVPVPPPAPAPGAPPAAAPAAPAAADPAAPPPKATPPGFNGDVAKFDAAVGPDAHRKLCLYAFAALTAPKDTALNLMGLDLATRLRYARPGLRAHYNANAQAAFTLDRFDDALAFPDAPSFKMPGGRLEYFDGQYNAILMVATAGKYTFEATVDDGVRIWIDGNPIYGTAAGLLGAGASAPVDLTAGLHDLRVDYSQGPSGAALNVFWSSPAVPAPAPGVAGPPASPGVEKHVIDKTLTRALKPAATQPAATQPATAPAAAAVEKK
ncbi:MAG: PA14 domain-containing protein [Planctomycetota bacterium]|nr:PA14 domain-containing protein [Planctomycetota bacterium]